MSEQDEENDLERPMNVSPWIILTELQLEGKHCDVIIKVNSVEFCAHKAILSACSPFFRSLFNNNWVTSDQHEYHISHISSETMMLIMNYVYAQQVNFTQENVCELLIAADYLAMSNLVNECSIFLKALLSPENCAGIWRFAGTYLCKKLKRYAFQFILQNFEKMVHVSEEFLKLTAEELSEIIQNDKLNVKQENVVFETIIRWIQHSPEDRKEHIAVLLSKVRMGLMAHNYFMDRVRNNVLVTENTACKLIVRSALRSFNTNSSSVSDLTRPRLPSAVLLAVGGWGNSGPTSAIEAYDMRAECWVEVMCGEETSRAYHGTVFMNGFIYCIGGFNGDIYFNSVSRFNPITKTWTQVSSMFSARCYVSVCALDNCIYALGGYNGNQRLKTAECFEAENNQWRMIAPMHDRRSDAGAAALRGRVYICGGFDGNEFLFTAEYYSAQTNQWTLLPHMGSRRSGVGVVIYSRKVYVVGGCDGINRLADAEVYNPETGMWRPIPDMITRRSNFGIGVVEDLLIVVGGYNGINTTSKVECYDGETAEWCEMEDLHIPRSAVSCCVLSALPNISEYAAPRQQIQQRSSRTRRGFITAFPGNN